VVTAAALSGALCGKLRGGELRRQSPGAGRRQ